MAATVEVAQDRWTFKSREDVESLFRHFDGTCENVSENYQRWTFSRANGDRAKMVLEALNPWQIIMPVDIRFSATMTLFKVIFKK